MYQIIGLLESLQGPITFYKAGNGRPITKMWLSFIELFLIYWLELSMNGNEIVLAQLNPAKITLSDSTQVNFLSFSQWKLFFFGEGLEFIY